MINLSSKSKAILIMDALDDHLADFITNIDICKINEDKPTIM